MFTDYPVYILQSLSMFLQLAYVCTRQSVYELYYHTHEE